MVTMVIGNCWKNNFNNVLFFGAVQIIRHILVGEGEVIRHILGGKAKCHMNFFDVLYFDFKSFESKKFSLKSKIKA